MSRGGAVGGGGLVGFKRELGAVVAAVEASPRKPGDEDVCREDVPAKEKAEFGDTVVPEAANEVLIAGFSLPAGGVGEGLPSMVPRLGWIPVDGGRTVPPVLGANGLELVVDGAKCDEVDLGVGGMKLIPGVFNGSVVVFGGALASFCCPRGVPVHELACG